MLGEFLSSLGSVPWDAVSLQRTVRNWLRNGDRGPSAGQVIGGDSPGYGELRRVSRGYAFQKAITSPPVMIMAPPR